MSVDFYVAIHADNWPNVEQVQQCASAREYPIEVQNFPSPDQPDVKNDGVQVIIDGTLAYLEGEVIPAAVAPEDLAAINEQLAARDSRQITTKEAVISFRTRSPSEIRAASYLIASLIVCFDGYGFEPQGNTSGQSDFAKTLLAGAKTLEGL
ncbi:hypothetical protein F7D01_08720 [Erythrobacter sp. 3-20A1M]|jgi:hypothetical protein|uniref:hypothetical protein n=1 Tax=Erythrobacter sp. 3-20A1M TaxID=2653850 RepID=UPI001BFCC17D|nr:hypothetical protein [Erythrobacter sp. 3-20A1M]QWC57158.1 hypothetical protein F7D01_08720 [Erythrobacter sp. 3-20A1M]